MYRTQVMQKKIGTILFSLLLCSVFFAPVAAADKTEDNYGVYIGKKLGTGFANTVTGWIELPKNLINTTNDPDTLYVLWGVIGGAMKGTLHAAGRTMTGVIDVVTFPLPTKPMIRPGLVWQGVGKALSML